MPVIQRSLLFLFEADSSLFAKNSEFTIIEQLLSLVQMKVTKTGNDLFDAI